MWIPTVKDIEQVVKQPDKLVTIKENATVAEAAEKMSNNQVGCLVVFDKQDKFVGVLTERDMLAKVLTTSLPPDNVLVKDLMTAEVISCNMDTTIGKVEQLMAEHKIRHVPIVENGVPVGMVSSRDTIAYRLRSNKAMKAAAEQLAMLSTGLKSLDFDDVVTLAINEAPKSFGAERAVLCFAQNDSSAAIIHRKGCHACEENLLNANKMKELSENQQVICSKICDEGDSPCAQASRLVIPLIIQDQCNRRGNDNANRKGFLCMCGFEPSSIGPEELRLYKASLLREVLSANLTSAKLYRDYQKARHDSEIDPLTGVGTRRVLQEVLKTECARAARYNHRFSVAIIDVDKFKQINDTVGHATGDRALQKLAKIMRSNVRMTDIIITRYGGDEFVLVMPGTRPDGAKVLLERIQRQVENISLPHVQSITISCGLTEWNHCPPDSPELLLSRADEALYEAKHKGRNSVVASQAIANTT